MVVNEFIKHAITSGLCAQLIPRSNLGDLALIQHRNNIGTSDGGNSVGDDEACAILLESVDCVVYQVFVLGI